MAETAAYDTADPDRLIPLGAVLYSPATGQVFDGDRAVASLRNKSNEVLHLLVKRAGTVVKKDEVLSSVWGDVFVSDDSLTRCISDIRKAIGDGNHRVVQTVHGKGYRLILGVAARPQRQLVAVISVGFAAGADGSGALDAAIAGFHGKILQEQQTRRVYQFASVMDAAECAVALQRDARAGGATETTPGAGVRIGINLGDLIRDQEGVHGDGIGAAIRLEQMADEGGICVSAVAYDQVKGRLDAGFEDLGPHAFDDRREPLHAYRVTLPSLSGGVARALPLPEKPSIAVMPFENLSGDHDEQYFSDGITADLTTALSRFDWLFVAARNSAFSYKGGAVDLGQVRRELGVRYLIEGSVRRAADRVRVNVEMIDTETSGQIWAEKYDRQMDDIFALQDDIVASIATTVGPEITLAEIGRTRNKRPDTLDAWDIYLRASALYHRMTAADLQAAIAHLERAVAIEPDFANAYALAGLCHFQRGVRGWVRPVGEAMKTARGLAEKAVHLSPASPEANHALGFILSMSGQAEESLIVARRAIDRNPNFSDAYSVLGHSLIFLGKLEEGLEACQIAVRANPRDQRGTWVYDAIGHAHFFMGDYEKAIEVSRKGLHMDPSLYGAWVTLACANAQLGRMPEARAAIDGLLKLIPRYSLRALEKNPMFIAPDLVRKLIDSMRLAGLPEQPVATE